MCRLAVAWSLPVPRVPICRWIMGRVWFGKPSFCHGLNNLSNSLVHSVSMSFQSMSTFILACSFM